MPELWYLKNTSQFFFQLYFDKKYIEVAINNLTVPLVILKWLRRLKRREKRKTMRQKEVKAKEKLFMKVF